MKLNISIMYKKLIILLILVQSSTAIDAQSFFPKNDKQVSLTYFVDPTFEDKGAQHGVQFRFGMMWGWVGLEASIYPELDPSYFDVVGSGGIRFEFLEKFKGYAGPRIGLNYRDGHRYEMIGGIIGIEYQLFDWLGGGFRIWVDHREDQENQYWGDSEAYKPGLIFTSPLSQENAAFTLTFYMN